MAEEDVIFGKNLHLYGGIEPSNMLLFKATYVYDDTTNQKSVHIKYKLPRDTVIDGQMICSVGGAIIRRSENGYPKDEFDGILIEDVTSNGELLDTNVSEGITYYYAAFPYSKLGVYNRSNYNWSYATVGNYTYIYGYDLDTNDSNPDTRVTYPLDTDNYDYSSFHVNSSTYEVSYGDWPIVPGKRFMPKPCVISYGGSSVQYLNPDNYAQTESGETISINTSAKGNVMMEWPKIYTKRWEDSDGIYHFRCSDAQVDSTWECICNKDINGNEIDHFYTSVYVGYVDSSGSRLRSVSGVKQSSYYNPTELKSCVANNGNGWNLECVQDVLLIRDLLTMLYKTTNITDLCGKHGTGNENSGLLNTNGLFYKNKVFGMEKFWGGYKRIVGNWRISGSSGFQSIDEYCNDNWIGVGNSKWSTTDSTDQSTAGYIKDMLTTKYGRLPITIGGSTTTYETDTARFENAQVWASTGGSYGCFGTEFKLYLSGTSDISYTNYCACLSFKPLATT